MDESIIYEPYEGLAPYIFVSYSHTEREKVDVILRLMFRNGIRIWYDKGLLAGENWENKIEEKLKNSQMFLCFLANGIEQRRVVLDEIRLAIKMNRADELYKVVFVFLEKMPSSAFEDEDIRSFIDEKQHILYRGITELMQNRQNDFKYSQIYTIETDLKTICEFEIMNNMKIGVRYQSPFSIVVLDLVRDRNDNMFGYERILPAVPSGAVVCVPIYNGKFVLLKQFRHALRTFQYGFPRGFGELELSPEQNAKKELLEELGCQVIKTEDLGEIVADSGLSGNKVRALLCEISTPKLNAEHEGIVSLELVSSNQLSQMISDHRINDGFTLAAYGILKK